MASNGNSKNVFIGPYNPIDGPTLPRLDADTPSADSKSSPNRANTIVPIIKESIYTMKKPNILCVISVETEDLLYLSGIIA